MDEALPVGIVESSGGFRNPQGRLPGRRPKMGSRLCQVRAFDKLHDDKRAPAWRLADAMNADDARMPEWPGHDVRFFEKLLYCARQHPARFAEHFHGHQAIEAFLPGPVDLAHAAAADQFAQDEIAVVGRRTRVANAWQDGLLDCRWGAGASPSRSNSACTFCSSPSRSARSGKRCRYSSTAGRSPQRERARHSSEIRSSGHADAGPNSGNRTAYSSSRPAAPPAFDQRYSRSTLMNSHNQPNRSATGIVALSSSQKRARSGDSPCCHEVSQSRQAVIR